jgi:hypothetical protein
VVNSDLVVGVSIVFNNNKMSFSVFNYNANLYIKEKIWSSMSSYCSPMVALTIRCKFLSFKLNTT